MTRQINVDGGYNVRDLGGYPTNNGHHTQWNKLIRAGNLDKISIAAQQQLIDYGVNTIIDLRDEWEAQQFPDVFAQSTTVKYMNLPLIGNSPSNNPSWNADAENYTLLYERYNKYLDHCQIQIRAIIAAISESTATTVFHCHAGKDRTGIVAALLLGVVGVPDHIVTNDYAHSGLQITHLVEQWRVYALQHGQDMQRFEQHVASQPETMTGMLNHLKKQYGGVIQYLKICGITESQITDLQRLLTQ